MSLSHSWSGPSKAELAKRLAGALDRLANAGARPTIEISPEAIARQLAWPEDSPLGETELRDFVKDLLQQLRAQHEKVIKLLGSLPEPSIAECRGEAPYSPFHVLYDAMSFLSEDGLGDVIDRVEAHLSATPENLRREWICEEIGESLGEVVRRQEALALVERLYGR